jgi:hypothetical protein
MAALNLTFKRWSKIFLFGRDDRRIVIPSERSDEESFRVLTSDSDRLAALSAGYAQ